MLVSVGTGGRWGGGLRIELHVAAAALDVKAEPPGADTTSPSTDHSE